jgi:hypothetical protein
VNVKLGALVDNANGAEAELASGGRDTDCFQGLSVGSRLLFDPPVHSRLMAAKTRLKTTIISLSTIKLNNFAPEVNISISLQRIPHCTPIFGEASSGGQFVAITGGRRLIGEPQAADQEGIERP